MNPVMQSWGGFTTAQVALLGVVVQFAVLSLGWLVAGSVLPSDRRAVAWWAAAAGGNALGLLLIVLGMRDAEPLLRAVGNVAVVAATMAMQRGLWVFMARPAASGVQAVVLAITAWASWLGMDDAWAPLRIGLVSALWAGLYLWSGLEVFAHVRREMRLHLALLHAAPLVGTAVMLLARCVRAIQSPGTVLHEVNADTALNLSSSLTGLVASLVLQLMLMGLVVTRLVMRLERASRHDPLTGLLNRRAMDELLHHEVQRQRRLPSPMAVLMIDLDHFKRLNDSRGHATGDRALQHLAALMSAQLREIDHLGRWGGEEFLALLPGTRGDEALVLAERLCQRLREHPLALEAGTAAVTATVGVADWGGGADTVDQLLTRADAALYAGKRGGRDRAVWQRGPESAPRPAQGGPVAAALVVPGQAGATGGHGGHGGQGGHGGHAPGPPA